MNFKIFIMIDTILFCILLLFAGGTNDKQPIQQEQQQEICDTEVVAKPDVDVKRAFFIGLIGKELPLDTNKVSK